jgi:Ca-activated chloride channel homolog
MRQHSSTMVASVLAAAAIPLLYAQAKPANTADEPATFRADTRLVVLHATVIDKSGKLVTNLQPKAFKVFENKVEQPIKKVLREDVPVSMGLIVDNSGSMRTKRQKVEAAALAMVRSSNPEDEVFIVNFNDEAFLEEPGFTSDIKVLERGLAKIDSRGGTAMRDAIRMSMDYLKENGKRDKKLLVVITDGEDNYSNVTLENLIRDVQRSEVPVQIYTIGLLSEEEKREAKKAERALVAIAEASGGASYIPKETGDIDKVCQQVAKDIRSQYIIEYNPIVSELDGSFRSIKVLATAPNHPTVRTRSGYYASPDKGPASSGASAKK